ncbi:MAG: hypothetical protein WBM32_16695 [Crocosphaera sp.]
MQNLSRSNLLYEFIPGFENFGPEDSELPVTFQATLISVPETSSTLSLLALATLGIGSSWKHKLDAYKPADK